MEKEEKEKVKEKENEKEKGKGKVKEEDEDKDEEKKGGKGGRRRGPHRDPGDSVCALSVVVVAVVECFMVNNKEKDQTDTTLYLSIHNPIIHTMDRHTDT